MKRYFIFSAVFNHATDTFIRNYGHTRNGDFPTIADLKDVVLSFEKEAQSIVILSITEVHGHELTHFFSKQ